MKLLICAQVVDSQDPVLGFMHAWIRTFAQEVESVEVICLREGVHDFPANVHVHSLGKERGARSSVAYAMTLVRLAWSLRSRYDTVLVHMIPEYVVVGAPLWRMLGKRIGLWYAHGAVTRMLRLAHALVHVVVTSTPAGFRLPSRKVCIVGQGIDTALFAFANHEYASPLRLTTVGRVSRSKDIGCLLRAVAALVTRGVLAEFTIVGEPITADDRVYANELVAMAASLGIADRVHFCGSVANSNLPAHLAASDIFIHAGRTGSLDKALLEALATGMPVLTSNDAFPEVAGELTASLTYPPDDHMVLAEKIVAMQTLDARHLHDLRLAVRAIVTKDHSILGLIQNIIVALT